MIKKNDEFTKSAEVIGEETKKWDSFGVIYDGSAEFRIFYAGNLGSILNGIAAGLENLIVQTGQRDIPLEIMMRLDALIAKNKNQLLM